MTPDDQMTRPILHFFYCLSTFELREKEDCSFQRYSHDTVDSPARIAQVSYSVCGTAGYFLWNVEYTTVLH